MGSEDKRESVDTEARDVPDILRVPGDQFPAHLLHPVPDAQVGVDKMLL